MGSNPISLQKVKNGSNRDLAKLITLLENPNTPDIYIDEVLTTLSTGQTKSKRIAISGPPGVGKSTLINNLGLNFIERGSKVAVLAIDPSSPIKGGSILGDKTRMDELAANNAAFVRPSPSKGQLGGINYATKSSILACEYAGYDTILIETVGVGQSEVEAAHICDLFLLLHQPSSGDELQGIKKGILEVANLIAVNKSDLGGQATLAAAELKQALHLSSKEDKPEVLNICANRQDSIDELQRAIHDFFDLQSASKNLAKKRIAQDTAWFYSELERRAFLYIKNNPKFKKIEQSKLQSLKAKKKSPYALASEVLRELL